jgi:hypothetical protein
VDLLGAVGSRSSIPKFQDRDPDFSSICVVSFSCAGNRHRVAEFKLLFLFVSGIIPGDTGRRIGMGRYADAAHGGGEGMHMGVAECVQCGCADAAEC